MERVRRELRGSVIALAMVAVTTVVVYGLTQSLEVRRGSVIYLLPVLLAGWHLGLIPALVAAVAGVLWSGYFFFSPLSRSVTYALKYWCCRRPRTGMASVRPMV